VERRLESFSGEYRDGGASLVFTPNDVSFGLFVVMVDELGKFRGFWREDGMFLKIKMKFSCKKTKKV